MKNLFIVIVAAFSVCFAASARQISENEALLKASSFSKKAVVSRLMSNSRSSAMTLAYTQKSAKSAADNCFYVFNRGNADGYVIVSADDRAESVLGYTDSGSFDYASLPSNARWWFSEYQREIQYLIDHPNLKAKTATPKTLSTSVAPLCKSLWLQSTPFNDNCPTYFNTYAGDTLHCAAGCVAIATSQVMYYHKWPVTGTGSTSYTSTVIDDDTLVYNLSADFSKSTYDWANMTDCYNSSSTTAQREAVAKLVSDVGIGVHMNYGPSSDSNTGPICNALLSYFDYDPSLSIVWRDLYSIDEWDNFLQNELNHKRPVIYGGDYCIDDGHEFVCDGYNSDDYYHINWGWGGIVNGYYKTTAFDPVVMGIGNGSYGGFDYTQDIIIQVMRPTTGYRHYECLAFDSISDVDTAIALGGKVNIKLDNITNHGNLTFNGKIGLITRDASGKIVAVQNVADVSDLDYCGSTESNYSFDYVVPLSLTDGVYSMRVEGLADGDSLWQQVRGYIGHAHSTDHYNITVSGSSASIVSSPSAPKLSVSATVLPHKLYNGKVGTVSATVANAGPDYHGSLFLYIFDANGDSVQSITLVADVLAGQSSTVSFSEIMVAPVGTAKFVITDNSGDSIGGFTAQILPTPAAPSLSLTAAPSFPDNDNVDPQDMQLSFSVKNSGGMFSNLVRASIFDENLKNLYYRETFIIADQDETSAFTFVDGLSECAPGKKYIARIYAKNDSGYWKRIPPADLNSVTFTVKPVVPSAISSAGTSASSIFPNPATDVVTIENASAITGIKVYSVTGSLVLYQSVSDVSSVTLNVASLPAGTYIVRVATAAGITVQRFIKR
jgi:hypothetical protein